MPQSPVRQPSFDLIRGFVAVGRRMSITLAARDLFLTQSAVSRQIQTLEEMLGVKLFVRSHRAISFTAEGERLFRVSDDADRRMQDIVGELRGSTARRPVTIAASVGFCGLWLLPRLGLMQKQAPGIDVRISANNRFQNPRSEGIDLVIRYARQSAAPAGATRLFGESVLPVAHPSLAAGRPFSAQSLAESVLLEYDDVGHPHLRWNVWLEAMGLAKAKPKAMLRFNQYDQMIHAAVAGQGLALGRLELLGAMFADHRLERLLAAKKAIKSEYAFWLIQTEAEPRADVQKVIAWIGAAARRGGLTA